MVFIRSRMSSSSDVSSKFLICHPRTSTSQSFFSSRPSPGLRRLGPHRPWGNKIILSRQNPDINLVFIWSRQFPDFYLDSVWTNLKKKKIIFVQTKSRFKSGPDKNLDGFVQIIWTRFESGRLLPTSVVHYESGSRPLTFGWTVDFKERPLSGHPI